MKTMLPAMAAHIAGSVTTLASCWTVARLDGVTQYFTDHDQDLLIGANTYVSNVGYDRTAIATDRNLTVDNLDVSGILSSDQIDEQALRNGVYDYASVRIFMVNWADLTMGQITLRTGWFGEVTVTPNGYFKAEMRGLTQALATNFGQVVSSQCRADLGDSRCKIPILPPAWTAGTTFVAGTFCNAVIDTSPTDDPYGGVIFECIIGGITGTAQPAFSSELNSQVTDGTVTWKTLNSYTKQGTVTAANSNKSFAVSGLLVPNGPGYGPNANILNVTVPVTGLMLPPPTVAGQFINHTITISTGTNQLQVDLNQEGGASKETVTYDPDGQSVTIIGQIGQTQLVLTSGITVLLNKTLTDVVTLTMDGVVVQTIPIPQVDTFYDKGTLTFVSGNNKGYSVEVYSYTNGLIVTYLSLPYVPQPGDMFRIYPGCDKTRANCLLFNNVLNMRAEPDLPGQDFLSAVNINLT